MLRLEDKVDANLKSVRERNKKQEQKIEKKKVSISRPVSN